MAGASGSLPPRARKLRRKYHRSGPRILTLASCGLYPAATLLLALLFLNTGAFLVFFGSDSRGDSGNSSATETTLRELATQLRRPHTNPPDVVEQFDHDTNFNAKTLEARPPDLRFLMATSLVPLALGLEERERQVRSVQAWLDMAVAPEVFLATDNVTEVDVIRSHLEPTAARRLNVLEGVRFMEFGEASDPKHAKLPIVGDVLARLEDQARPNDHNVLVYTNSDMVLYDEFVDAALFVANVSNYNPFVVVGKRWEIDLNRFPDSARWSWEKVRYNSLLYGHATDMWHVDYFAFGVGTFETSKLPDMVLGRPRFDNFLLANAKGLRVDASIALVATHQAHNYVHSGFGANAAGSSLSGNTNPLLSSDDAGRAHNEDVIRTASDPDGPFVSYKEGTLSKVCMKLRRFKQQHGVRRWCLMWRNCGEDGLRAMAQDEPTRRFDAQTLCVLPGP